MKRWLFISLLALFATGNVYAAENYIMLLDFPVKKVVVRDDNILKASSVSTVDNEKRQTILTPKVKNGETVLLLKLSDGDIEIDVTIKDGVVFLSEENAVKLFELDMPEEK